MKKVIEPIKKPGRGRPKGSKNAVKKTDPSKPTRKKRVTKTKPVKKTVKKVADKVNSKKTEIILKKLPTEKIKIEIWPVQDDIYKIYAENKEFIEKLGKILKESICATYMKKNGKEFGWDMFFKKSDLKTVNQLCKKIA